MKIGELQDHCGNCKLIGYCTEPYETPHLCVYEGQDDVDESGISTGLLHTLLEYADYKKIGTVEECREARERQSGKKPYIQSDGHRETEIDCFECPNCGSFLGYVSDCKDEQYQDDYCRNCGQAILWEGYNE